MSARKGFAPIVVFIALGILLLVAFLIIKSDFLFTFKYSPFFVATQPVNLSQTIPQESLDTPLCDVNADGKCNTADLDLLKQALGANRGQKEYIPLADLDADGMINEIDKQILLNLLDQNSPSPQSLQSNSPNNNQPPIVQLVKKDLSELLKIPENAIAVLNVEKAEWPDSCLGVDTGELCAQVITPGYKISLKGTNNKIYIYHTDLSANFILEKSKSGNL